ncbi:MAG: putative PEP-binding protein, partial [Propionibacteriaceae bacterium]
MIKECVGEDGVGRQLAHHDHLQVVFTATKSVLAQHRLRRGDNDLEVIMMCELPSNAVLADAFLDHFDGFSIGSNDLTQLT